MTKISAIPDSHFDPIDVHLGQRLRNFRSRVGWTLMELANRVGVSHQQIHKYEQGQSKISAGMLYKLAAVFSTPPSSFFEGYNPEKHMPAPLIIQNDIISLKAKDEIKLLLIEDSASDEFLVRKVLETFPHKFEIYCLHNGEDAIHYLKGRVNPAPFIRPDIILLDLNLPKLGGLAILRAIKQDRDIQDIPVLVLTNSLSKQDMLNAYKNFASGYISKSFDFTTFKKNLQTALTYWVDAVILPDA